MAKPTPKSTTATKTKPSAKTEESSKVVANPRLVAAIRASDAARDEYKSSLVAIAEVAQSEQLGRAEIVASLIEARGIQKSSAESQYSRMKKLMSDPEVMSDLKSGKIDLKMAREKTTKKQTAPNKEKQRDAVEKRFASGLAKMIEAAKEGGMDLASILASVKANCKKAGVK